RVECRSGHTRPYGCSGRTLRSMDAEDIEPEHVSPEYVEPEHVEPEHRQVRWQDFTPVQQVTIIGAALFELSLLVAALVARRRRPAKAVRGCKAVSAAVSFVILVAPSSSCAFAARR